MNPATVSAEEMSAVLNRVLPEQLRKSGVEDPAEVCVKLLIRLNAQHFEKAEKESRRAEAFFQRVLTPRR